MAKSENRKDGYEPEQRGYQPKETDKPVKPPTGGTGENIVQQDQGNDSSDSDTANDSDDSQ